MYYVNQSTIRGGGQYNIVMPNAFKKSYLPSYHHLLYIKYRLSKVRLDGNYESQRNGGADMLWAGLVDMDRHRIYYETRKKGTA